MTTFFKSVNIQLFLPLAFMFFSLLSCYENNSIQILDSKQISAQDSSLFLTKGREISSLLQQELLKNVTTSVQKEGFVSAINFCHLNALPLTDSISSLNQVKVQRLSDKNRNSKNEIFIPKDKKAWNKIQLNPSDFIEISKEGDVTYYKPIRLEMPTCLKCHGTKDDISKDVELALSTKYPKDKAVGYQLNELRGMWKIEF